MLYTEWWERRRLSNVRVGSKLCMGVRLAKQELNLFCANEEYII